MNIVLLGYMGVGKSTIAKVLSEALQFKTIDLDDYISEKEKQSLPCLFKERGEIYFRKQEQHYLNTLISDTNTVLALGGGTPCYGNAMSLINKSEITTSIYLKASVSTLVSRLFTEKDSRPLISHINSLPELSEFISKHLFERSPYYNQSNYTINTDNKSVKAIIEEILFLLF